MSSSWEIIYFNFMPDFADKYAAHVARQDARRAAPPRPRSAEAEGDGRVQGAYDNPLINVGMTFIEIFPVGLIVTLVSAAILRRKQTPGIRPAATAAVS